MSATVERAEQMLRRQSPLLLALVFAVLVAAALGLARAMGDGEPDLTGTDLGRQPAADFALTDQRGQTVRLSDFRGQAIVLTFIYTSCPDVCPLIAENLRVAYEILPVDARDDVALLAVTVDPARDTQAALEQFSELHRLADNPSWHALRGDPDTLERVWQDYGVYPGTGDATPTSVHAHGTPEPETPSAGGGVGHTDAIYIIDAEGRLRVFLRSNATPQVVAENLTKLVE